MCRVDVVPQRALFAQFEYRTDREIATILSNGPHEQIGSGERRLLLAR